MESSVIIDKLCSKRSEALWSDLKQMETLTVTISYKKLVKWLNQASQSQSRWPLNRQNLLGKIQIRNKYYIFDIYMTRSHSNSVARYIFIILVFVYTR